MKLQNKQILIGAGVVGAVGLYLVIKYYMSNRDVASYSSENNNNIDTKKTNQNKSNNIFPIKKGDIDKGSPSKAVGKVVNLQRLINEKGYINISDKFKGKPLMKLVEDGNFGPKTESAIMFYINKKSIDSQNDLDALKAAIMPALPQ